MVKVIEDGEGGEDGEGARIVLSWQGKNQFARILEKFGFGVEL